MPSVAPVTTAHEPSFRKLGPGLKKYVQMALANVNTSRRMTTMPIRPKQCDHHDDMIKLPMRLASCECAFQQKSQRQFYKS